MNKVQDFEKLKEAIEQRDFSVDTYELFCSIEDYDGIYDNIPDIYLKNMMSESFIIKNIELFKNVVEHYENYIRLHWFNTSEAFINSGNFQIFTKDQLDVYFYLFLFPQSLYCIDYEMYVNISTMSSKDFIMNHDFTSIQSECEDFIVSLLERIRNYDDMYLDSILDIINLFKFCIKPEMNIPEFILIKLFGENGFKNKYMEIESNEIIKKYKYIIGSRSFDVPMAMMSVMNKEELTNGYLDILCSELILTICNGELDKYKETEYFTQDTCALFSYNFNNEKANLNIDNLKLFVNRFIELAEFTKNSEIAKNLLECLDFFRVDYLIDATKLNKFFKVVLMEKKLGGK